MTSKARTTASRARKETVAREAKSESNADAAPTSVVTPDQLPPSKGRCDNHPDRAAILHVTREQMPWLVHDQRFCNLCVPGSYKYLL